MSPAFALNPSTEHDRDNWRTWFNSIHSQRRESDIRDVKATALSHGTHLNFRIIPTPDSCHSSKGASFTRKLERVVVTRLPGFPASVGNCRRCCHSEFLNTGNHEYLFHSSLNIKLHLLFTSFLFILSSSTQKHNPTTFISYSSKSHTISTPRPGLSKLINLVRFSITNFLSQVRTPRR